MQLLQRQQIFWYKGVNNILLNMKERVDGNDTNFLDV
jgi:hypothetical protein